MAVHSCYKKFDHAKMAASFIEREYDVCDNGNS